MYNGVASVESEDQVASGCVAHLVRDPFEKTVSGYLYHKAGSEDWAAVSVLQTYVYGQYGWWKWLFHDQVVKLYNETLLPGGGAMGLAPWDASRAPSYADYLSSIPPEDGLVAEWWRSNIMEFVKMQQIQDWVSSSREPRPTDGMSPSGCSRSLCLDDLSSVLKDGTHVNRLEPWQSFLQDSHVPQSVIAQMLRPLQPKRLLRSRALLQPAAHVTDHSSYRDQMLRLLHKVDQERLGGSIFEMKRRLGC